MSYEPDDLASSSPLLEDPAQTDRARKPSRQASSGGKTNSEQEAAGGTAGQFVVFAFLAVVLGFGARSLLLKDNRFGWGMFNHQVEYVVEYEWLLEDGSTIPCSTDELRGKARRKLGSGHPHTMLYGIGALRLWIRNYLEHLHETARPEGAVEVRANLAYAVNPTDFSKSEHQKETFAYP